MKSTISIEKSIIGQDCPCFIIGEIGSNHNRDKKVVCGLIDAAAKAGFNAVKFQIYDAAEAFSKKEMTTDVRLDHLYGVRPWWEVARDHILMPREWFGEMFAYARDNELIPLCAIHRREDADFLLQFDLPAFKVASIDLHYHHLLDQLKTYGRPLLISTGMAHLSEIDETMRLLEASPCDEVILLHCVSCYPPRYEDLNLRNIPMLRDAFGVPIGYSDHSMGIVSAVAAVTLGAKVIEKHITLDRTAKGPDHPFALEPDEMSALAEAVRNVEKALGKPRRHLSADETDARRMIRRSIITRVPIKAGERVTLDKIKFARPGTGISTNEFRYVEGKKVNRDVPAEEILQWHMVESHHG